MKSFFENIYYWISASFLKMVRRPVEPHLHAVGILSVRNG